MRSHRRRQPNFRHQQQRTLARVERGLNRLQVNLRLARARYAVQQEGLKLIRPDRAADGIERRTLRRVQLDLLVVGSKRSRLAQDLQLDDCLLGQLARYRARILAVQLQRLDVLLAGVIFEVIDQPTLALSELGRRLRYIAQADDPTPIPCAQRVALGDIRLESHQSLLDHRLERLLTVGDLLLEVGFGQRTLLQRPQHLHIRVVRVRRAHELLRHLGASVGQRHGTLRA